MIVLSAFVMQSRSICMAKTNRSAYIGGVCVPSDIRLSRHRTSDSLHSGHFWRGAEYGWMEDGIFRHFGGFCGGALIN